MAVINDTTSKVINGKDGTADFVLPSGTNTLSYKCVLDSMEIRELVELTGAETFCNEGTATQEAGRSQLAFQISGLGMKGGPASGPLIPAPQNVAVVMTFSTSCTASFSANFSETTFTRLVNTNARMSGRGVSRGTYVISWVLV